MKWSSALNITKIKTDPKGRKFTMIIKFANRFIDTNR